MKTLINGLEIEYSQSGAGPDILILHGWGRDSSDWSRVTAVLSQRFRVWLIDLPGFGKSQTPPESWGLDEYAGLVDAFVKTRNISQLILIAHSFGGRIGILLGSQNSAYLKKLILVAAAGIKPKLIIRSRLFQACVKLGKVFLGIFPHALRRKIKSRFYDALRSQNIEYAMLPKMMSVFKHVVSKDLRPLLKNINIPTLLLWGENDTAVPVEAAKIMQAEIPNAVLKVLPGTGHFLFKEKESEFVKLLNDFLG